MVLQEGEPIPLNNSTCQVCPYTFKTVMQSQYNSSNLSPFKSLLFPPKQGESSGFLYSRPKFSCVLIWRGIIITSSIYPYEGFQGH